MALQDDVPIPFWLIALILTFVMQLVGFGISFSLKTERFYDFFGASNFLLLALGTWAVSAEPSDPRRAVSSILFAASRLWLLVFLSLRASKRGDSRFDEVKDKWIFVAFWLGQAGWAYLISMPIIAINLADESIALGPFGTFCAITFAAALVTQAHSDWIKKIWVDAGREGVFCRRGCWEWSRHPNYFGEVTMTFAAVCLAGPFMVGAEGDINWLAALSVLSPVYTFTLLMFVTGVPTGEGVALRRYYERVGAAYAAYRAKTPVLIPWCCPGFETVPQAAKWLCCCEWKRYELPEHIMEEVMTNRDAVDGAMASAIGSQPA